MPCDVARSSAASIARAADDGAEAVVAIDQDSGARRLRHPDLGPRVHDAGLDPLRVHRQANHPVRIDAAELRLDQTRGHFTRVRRRNAELLQHAAAERQEIAVVVALCGHIPGTQCPDPACYGLPRVAQPEQLHRRPALAKLADDLGFLFLARDRRRVDVVDPVLLR